MFRVFLSVETTNDDDAKLSYIHLTKRHRFTYLNNKKPYNIQDQAQL